METPVLSATGRASVDELVSDLRRIFGARLQSVVAYGLEHPAHDEEGVHTLTLVDLVGFADLAACVANGPKWHRAGLATPLILSRDEFLRTLDVFPIEYGAIIGSHVPIVGANPFAGCAVCEADLRRAVELQAKSHLIHLREGFLETGGRPDAVSRLLAASVPAYRALLRNLERLNPDAAEEQEATMRLLQELSARDTIADPTALLQRYIADVERIWQMVDAWRR